MKDPKLKDYTNLDSIRKEVEDSKTLFKKNNWPSIDVTRKTVVSLGFWYGLNYAKV